MIRRAAPLWASLALAAGLAQAAIAQSESQSSDWLAPADFLALTAGQVMDTFHADGKTIFGHEEFGPDGSVIWQYPDGTCLTGQIEIRAGAVCYLYDGHPAPSCLRYQARGTEILGHQWDLADSNRLSLWPDVRLRPSARHALDCGPPPIG